MPSVNGIRPITTLLTMPAANSHVAVVATAGDGAAARAIGTNAAVAADGAERADPAPARATAASGANSSE